MFILAIMWWIDHRETRVETQRQAWSLSQNSGGSLGFHGNSEVGEQQSDLGHI